MIDIRHMKRLLVLSLVLPAALAVADDEAADEEPKFRLFGQSTTYVEFNQAEDSNDEDYTKVKQAVRLNIEWNRWTAGAQVEYLEYSDKELADRLDLDRQRDTLELRRYFIDYKSDHFSSRLGTFFSSFGRGMTLYVQKNEALAFDEPIHGGTMTVNFDRFEFTALGGEVTEPVLQNQYDRTFKDNVWGGRLLGRLPGDLYLGGSFVRADLDRFFPEGTDEIEVWSVEGGGTEVGGLFDVHAEWAEIERREAAGVKHGHGGYASVSTYAGPFTILAEYKDYWNFQYRYNSPPNAGRAIENYSHQDIKGPRLLVSVDLASIGAILSGSYGWFNSQQKPGSLGGTEGDRQNEWYVELQEMTGPIYMESSYFNRKYADRGIRQEHIISDWHFSVGDRSEILAGYDKRLEKSQYFSLATHRSFAGYSLSPYGVLTLRYAWEERSGFDTESFWGGSLEYLPSPKITLSLFGGSDPGGLVCSGGQCRIEPRFKGYKATLSWRF